jgi:Alw26I/Eco31I/Esp3I family type II restriction m6 adenine DNA methyltransferase
MKHTTILKLFEETRNAKSGTTKALGRFYSPEIICTQIAKDLTQLMMLSQGANVSVIDPFCGDGRLIISFLLEVARLIDIKKVVWHISFWDYDEQAVILAKDNIEKFLIKSGIEAELDPQTWDTFINAQAYYGAFDIVITNPPWETLKPDRRELAQLPPSAKKHYLLELKEYDKKLEEVLPFSQPLKKYAGWGTNLSRCGTEVSVNLLKPYGLCGIVVPYSMMLDQMSIGFRKWLFSIATITSLSNFPAESKLFDYVDTDIATITIQKISLEKHDIEVKTFDRDAKLGTRDKLQLNEEFLKLLEYSVPDKPDQTFLNLIRKWEKLAYLGDLEGRKSNDLWLGRELDETGYESYTKPMGIYPFLKGKMMGRFSVFKEPTLFLDEGIKKIPPSAFHHRLVWRDVSRRSQVRRMQVTVIHPFIVTGNSVHVGYYRSDDLPKLMTLMAIMNSLPFEYQVKSKLGTGHISLGVVRKTKIPDLSNKIIVNKIYELTTRMLNEQDEKIQIELEVLIAKLYGLTRDEYESLLARFELSQTLKEELLSPRNWKNLNVHS